jgi:hypothetical protein
MQFYPRTYSVFERPNLLLASSLKALIDRSDVSRPFVGVQMKFALIFSQAGSM